MTFETSQQPLTDERLTEITETHPGDWYSGEWRSEYVEATGDDESECAYYRIFHVASGAELATLPDRAGPIALFMADAHEAVPALVAEVRRLQQQRRYLIDQLRRKDAASGEADRKVREFLAAEPEGEPEPSTRPCGHDDYHDGHPWHDQPHVWCPGHSFETDAVSSA